MDFYTHLSQYYDELFPSNPKQTRFLTERCSAGARVLDIGAGTGGYSAALSKTGAIVEALEIGAMYPKLQESGAAKGFVAREMGMEQIGELEPQAYSLMVCIGNTLVHLGDQGQVTDFLKACKNLLIPGGELILQIVNYDRVLKHRQTSLPRISLPDKGITLERSYILGYESVQFITKLTVQGREYVSETQLLALKLEGLLRCLEEAGFTKIHSFGDFESSPWNEDSPATVVVAGT